ncbi:VOC family protein [Bacillus cereus]|uniref:PhnB-like domain-containing protein n=1 Tax=Bacillus cereus VD184 TaxID=1053242 RepID=A0A9W5VUT3_BACCE|nr:VOC family protein [Bacillus cereus]EOQ18670.1 hypothetical protein IKC_05171 [Bacillus cereus VD184]
MAKQKIIPYLMFNGQAEEAMNYYISICGGSINFLTKYGENKEHLPHPISEEELDRVIHAQFTLMGNSLYCSDRAGENQVFEQGNSISLTIECESEEEIERLYVELAKNGKIFMPLQDTFWNAKYAVFADKYGITWQLDYAKDRCQPSGE